MKKRIGVLTAGSDSPGMNAAIRAIGKSATQSYGMEVIGFLDGFEGLVHDHTVKPTLSGILTAGGTTLGTSRGVPEETLVEGQVVDMSDQAVETYHRHHLDVLVCIGGRETQESAYRLMQKGINVITLPKSIDNALPLTDTTIGFDTALGTATEAIDRLHSTAYSLHRLIIVEIIGRDSGWLTLGAGISGGADVIIIPEIPYDLDKIVDAVQARHRSGRRFSIIAVAEGGISKETVEFFDRSKYVNQMYRSGEEQAQVEQQLETIENRLTGNTVFLANRLNLYTGLDVRITILGQLLRGGAPSATDRILATQLGTTAVSLIHKKHFGVMLSCQNGEIVPVPLEEVVGKKKPVPLDHPWIESARQVGTSLGD
ncbi:MAG: ATP-dependent 6-phosphofructokinase [Chloroflexi bacterium]|nr:ATP-dependent 6-phosphofructokinase [Chloroflexota bacterium]